MPTNQLPPPMAAPEVSLKDVVATLTSAPSPGLLPKEAQTLERLIRIAKGDTGQSRRVADFLLAWWNAGSCGGFDLTSLWGVDESIATDMATVFAAIARVNAYPDTLGYEADFKAIVREWRPELAEG